MKAALALALALVAAAPGTAWAQRDERDRMPERGSRAVYAGDFVLMPHAEEMLLIDGKTGCVWRRTPRSNSDPGYWRFEFPNGFESNCNERLANARRAAIAGTNP